MLTAIRCLKTIAENVRDGYDGPGLIRNESKWHRKVFCKLIKIPNDGFWGSIKFILVECIIPGGNIDSD